MPTLLLMVKGSPLKTFIAGHEKQVSEHMLHRSLRCNGLDRCRSFRPYWRPCPPAAYTSWSVCAAHSTEKWHFAETVFLFIWMTHIVRYEKFSICESSSNRKIITQNSTVDYNGERWCCWIFLCVIFQWYEHKLHYIPVEKGMSIKTIHNGWILEDMYMCVISANLCLTKKFPTPKSNCYYQPVFSEMWPSVKYWSVAHQPSAMSQVTVSCKSIATISYSWYYLLLLCVTHSGFHDWHAPIVTAFVSIFDR